jgi:hypothetical protein
MCRDGEEGREMKLTDDQKVKMRAFLQAKGQPVDFREKRYEWDQPVSTYGWHDNRAMEHTMTPTRSYGKHYYGDGCSWVVEPGVVLREVTYSMFTDTFSDNADEVGVECSPVRCECGKYTDVTLRWVGSLGDLMRAIFGPVVPDTGVVL